MYDSSRIRFALCALACAITVLAVCAQASAKPSIRAPWACGEAFPVSQSHKTGSHIGKGSWSWDFAMPVGTQLIAPAEGVVRAVRQDSKRYGCDSSYAYDANYIIVDFEDGTEALFLHLQAGSVPVSVGERVFPGDLLGRVGMSGWTCGPHLHFQIQRTCDSWWCTSVPAEFTHYGDPKTGDRIVSRNCSAPAEEPQLASYSTEVETPQDAPATGGVDDEDAAACWLP